MIRSNILPLTERQLVKYLRKVSHVLFTKLIEDSWDKHEEVTDHNVSMRRILENLKEVKNAVKEDPTLNKKVLETTEACTKNSINLTELLTLVKSFDFQGLKSSIESLQVTALSQDQHLSSWAKSSTSMAWNLGPRMTVIESSQAEIRSEISSLRQDTSYIKSMMTDIYNAFKGQPFSTPSGSVPATLDITIASTSVEGENVANTADKEHLSHTEGEHVSIEDDTKKATSDKAEEEPTRAVPISTVRPITRPNPEVALIESSSRPPLTDPILEIPKLAPASKIIREDSDEPIGVPYMINGKMHYLTNDEINAHMEKEDKIKKAIEEAKMFEKSKTEFKKAQDDEHQVLKREHSQKVKRLMELNKKIAEQYIWTIFNILKPEPITDVRIHPNSKPAVLTVFKNNDKRNFQVYIPFKFSDFGVTELDELGLIIQKKKNTIVKYLMISLGKRYERLKKIPGKLGIQSSLPAPILEKAPSQSSGRKRKHMELEPEIKVPGLECNRSLPEGVPFVNNMVIEEPEYGIFFTDMFGDQAFQRWNDIHKVGVDSLVSYSVIASIIKTLENARFCLKLKKLIAEHPDQEKLQSKKVKLESVIYKLD
ncbi:hypothetical protein Tco_1255915 [Tanacetum coccineum]